MDLQRIKQLAGIRLDESVTAIPGIGQLDEKSKSENQARFMAAAAHNPEFAKKTGMDASVAKEFNKADKGTDQLSNAMKNEGVEVDEKAPPGMEAMVKKLKKEYPGHPEKAFATAWSIYNKKHKHKKHKKAEEGYDMEEELNESDSLGINQDVIDQALAHFEELLSLYVEPEEALEVVLNRCSEENVGPDEMACIRDAILSTYGGPEDEVQPTGNIAMEPGDEMNDDNLDEESDDGISLGADVFPVWDDKTQPPMQVIAIIDNQRVKVVDDFGNNKIMFIKDLIPVNNKLEELDLNNGYGDINDASGNDYFPSGSDGPILRTAGPSSAHMGDNPEQKRMQVAEVHKELVYGYRDYLKEADIQKKK